MFFQLLEDFSFDNSQSLVLQASPSVPCDELPDLIELQDNGSNLRSINQIQQVSKDFDFQSHHKMSQQVGLVRIQISQDQQNFSKQSNKDVILQRMFEQPSSQFPSEISGKSSNQNIVESQHISDLSWSQFSQGIFPNDYFKDQPHKYYWEEDRFHSKCPINVSHSENQFMVKNSFQNLSKHNQNYMDEQQDEIINHKNPADRQKFQEQIQQNLSTLQTKNKCLKTKQNKRKNAFSNIIKSAKRRIFQDNDQESVFNKKLTKLCRKASLEFEEEVQVWQFKHFCRDLPYEFTLQTINHYMNYEIGSISERKMKFVFSQFIVWFISRRYTVQALKSKQLEFKETYFRTKNLIVYLPTTKPKKVQKPKKNTLSIK